jgi:hypothetical protein
MGRHHMKIPVVLQTIGLIAIPLGVLLVFGVGWCVLAFGASAATVGTALEVERR